MVCTEPTGHCMVDMSAHAQKAQWCVRSSCYHLGRVPWIIPGAPQHTFLFSPWFLNNYCQTSPLLNSALTSQRRRPAFYASVCHWTCLTLLDAHRPLCLWIMKRACAQDGLHHYCLNGTLVATEEKENGVQWRSEIKLHWVNGCLTLDSLIDALKQKNFGVALWRSYKKWLEAKRQDG